MSLLCVVPSRARASSALERLEMQWSAVRDYRVSIDAHEELGSKTENRELQYSFRKPAQARLDLISNGGAVATILWSGGDDVVAFRHRFSFLKIRGNLHDRRFTSLRGNGVLTPNLGLILACFEQNKSAVQEYRGPTVDGESTDEIVLVRMQTQCPDDPPADRDVTRDVLDVARGGFVVIRKRYEGDKLVEWWTLRNYQVNTGLNDRAFSG